MFYGTISLSFIVESEDMADVIMSYLNSDEEAKRVEKHYEYDTGMFAVISMVEHVPCVILDDLVMFAVARYDHAIESSDEVLVIVASEDGKQKGMAIIDPKEKIA